MKVQLTAILMFLCCSIFAQTYVDIPWRAGTITTKKGAVEEGMIRLGGDLGAPWLNHSKVYFVPQADYVEGKRVKKKKIKEYKPGDIAAYSTFTEDEGGERIAMDFYTGEIMVMGALRKKKGKAFLQLRAKGVVDLYAYIPKPSKKILTSREERYKDQQYALNQSTYYLRKGEDELISAVDCELVDYLADCPTVVEQIKNEAYGFKPKSERPKKKDSASYWRILWGDNNLENQIAQAVRDFNNCVE